MSRLLVAVLLVGVAGAGGPHLGTPVAESPPPARRFLFERALANIESVVLELSRQAVPSITIRPAGTGQLWHGRVMRRLPGDGMTRSDHYVSFAADYVGGVARRGWCDVNFNGDLTDDPPLSLSPYPKIDRARSFLVDLAWTVSIDDRDLPLSRKVRVVLEPQDSDYAPLYRVQEVYAMVGTVEIEGKGHRAFLFDGNGDGLYTKDFLDGVFVDLNDDRQFEVDPMSRDFGPFGTPFQMGRRIYEVTKVDRRGSEITMVETAETDATAPPSVGEAAPPFTLRDSLGREIRLRDYRGRYVVLYFWSSWCGKCSGQADDLGSLYERHRPTLEIIGISYDTERSDMDAFRKEHRQSFPTSFSGRMFWEDPIGRLYQARSPGALYLIDGSGRLDGIYEDVQDLAVRLAEVLPPRQPAADSAPPR